MPRRGQRSAPPRACSPSSAAAWPHPADTCAAAAGSWTCCGASAAATPGPRPSCPRLLRPKANTLPSRASANDATPLPVAATICSHTAEFGAVGRRSAGTVFGCAPPHARQPTHVVPLQRGHRPGHGAAAKLAVNQRPPQLLLLVAAPGPQLALQRRRGCSAVVGRKPHLAFAPCSPRSRAPRRWRQSCTSGRPRWRRCSWASRVSAPARTGPGCHAGPAPPAGDFNRGVSAAAAGGEARPAAATAGGTRAGRWLCRVWRA